MPVPRSFVRGCRMLIYQFYHPLAIDLWEHLYKEKPASATIWVPVWSERERYDTGFPFSWNAFHLTASLYHSCHLDTLSAFKTQFIKWVGTSVTPDINDLIRSASAPVLLRLSMKRIILGIIIGCDWFPCPLSLGSEERLSLTLPSSHCLDLDQAAWYLGKSTCLAVIQNWTETPNLKSSCWVIQVRHSKFGGFSVLLVKILKVRSHRLAFQDQVIWNSAHGRHIHYKYTVCFPMKKVCPV